MCVIILGLLRKHLSVKTYIPVFKIVRLLVSTADLIFPAEKTRPKH